MRDNNSTNDNNDHNTHTYTISDNTNKYNSSDHHSDLSNDNSANAKLNVTRQMVNLDGPFEPSG